LKDLSRSGIITLVTMLLNHAFSYRLWQRSCALPAMTFVIVLKGARESVRDR
jgi:hypothetical protein